jgi:hypothetical protein
MFGLSSKEERKRDATASESLRAFEDGVDWIAPHH